MLKLRKLLNFRSGFTHVTILARHESTGSAPSTMEFNKVLIVSKMSRYEFERIKNSTVNTKEFEKSIRKRGTNFDNLIHFHDLHKKFEERVVNTLLKMDLKVDVVNRFTLSQDKVDSADVIMPVGGDGTFLLASSKVMDNNKPVVGFNSDTNRSEGHLCLPKQYSNDIKSAIKKLQNGDFKWLMRRRLRTTMIVGDEINLVPKYLHGGCHQNMNYIPKPKRSTLFNNKNVLPVLALNEIFIGESLSARVSHLQMRLNGSTENTNLKCSGVCICSGTGSTSWNLSINRLPVQTVAELLRLIDVEPTNGKEDLAKRLSDIYNQNLIFTADDNRMGYTIRDLISAGVWPQPKGIKSRGFATNIEITSNCFDATLVVDGGVSFDFNDGAIAMLEIRPEDALRTVLMS